MNYKFPDSEAMKHQALLKYKEEFLKLNDLKIGDKVTLDFPYHRVYKEPRKEPNRVTWEKQAEGILKEDEQGYLYAESLENMDFYRFDNHFRRPEYKLEKRKSVFKFRP